MLLLLPVTDFPSETDTVAVEYAYIPYKTQSLSRSNA